MTMILIRQRQSAIKVTSGKAFTFIEVMVALAIVSISLLALLKLHLMSIKMLEKADATCQAVFLAEEKLAETLAQGFPKEGTASGELEKNGVLFSWRTEVAANSVGGLDLPQLHKTKITGLKKILVGVSCKQSLGGGAVQMLTYVADSSRRSVP
jgi:type II secretion system protein I